MLVRRERGPPLFALSCIIRERSGTRAVVCPILTTYYVEHVYSRRGRERGEERSREALPDVQQLLAEDGWNNASLDRSRRK